MPKLQGRLRVFITLALIAACFGIIYYQVVGKRSQHIEHALLSGQRVHIPLAEKKAFAKTRHDQQVLGKAQVILINVGQDQAIVPMISSLPEHVVYGVDPNLPMAHWWSEYLTKHQYHWLIELPLSIDALPATHKLSLDPLLSKEEINTRMQSLMNYQAHGVYSHFDQKFDQYAMHFPEIFAHISSSQKPYYFASIGEMALVPENFVKTSDYIRYLDESKLRWIQQYVGILMIEASPRNIEFLSHWLKKGAISIGPIGAMHD